MKREIELISHGKIHHLNILVNQVKYRKPHIHSEFEFLYLLDGELTVNTLQDEFHLLKGDFIVFNPYQIHELRAKDNAYILVFQIDPDFNAKLQNIEFASTVLSLKEKQFQGFLEHLFTAANNFFLEYEHFECLVEAHVLICLHHLLSLIPSNQLSTCERIRKEEKVERVTDIKDFINRHYKDKVLLKDLAAHTSLSLNYLSHFFTDNFGISFQSYLSNIRCEEAKKLLEHSKDNLLEIASEVGFSDVRYFNRAFLEKYGVTPKEYRNANLSGFSSENVCKQTSDLEEIFNKQKSLSILNENYLTFN